MDQRHLRRGDPARVRRARDPVLQLRRLRPLLHGLRRHGARHRVRRGRHDVREEQRATRPRCASRSSTSPSGPRCRRPRSNKLRILGEWHDAWVEAQRQGAAGELEPNEVVQPEQRGPASPCRTSRCASTSSARATAPSATRSRRWCGGCSGWTSRCAGSTRDAVVDDFTPYGRDDAPRALRARRLRDQHGPAPEALGAGDAQRGHLHAVPVLLRRHGLEPAAAVQRRGRLLGRPLRARDARRCGPRRGRQASHHGRRPSIALYSMSQQFSRGLESAGWLRFQLDQWGLRLPRRDRGGHQGGRPARRRRPARAGRLRDRGPGLPGGPVRPRRPRAGGPEGAPRLGQPRRPLRRLARRRACWRRASGVSSATFEAPGRGTSPRRVRCSARRSTRAARWPRTSGGSPTRSGTRAT